MFGAFLYPEIMKKIFSIVFCSFLLLSCNTSKENVHFYVKKLIEGKRYESQIIGLGFPGYQWPHYLKFKELATKKQLIQFCHHKNRIIRAYSFKALMDLDMLAARKIYLRQENIKMTLRTMSGCITHDSRPLKDVYAGIVWGKFPWDFENIENDSINDAHFKMYYWFIDKP